ncbi:Uncharacterised protein [Vibrio cholerae]|nr:Uncharacterised protein [Vibrio cholerae]
MISISRCPKSITAPTRSCCFTASQLSKLAKCAACTDFSSKQEPNCIEGLRSI